MVRPFVNVTVEPLLAALSAADNTITFPSSMSSFSSLTACADASSSDVSISTSV